MREIIRAMSPLRDVVKYSPLRVTSFKPSIWSEENCWSYAHPSRHEESLTKRECHVNLVSNMLYHSIIVSPLPLFCIFWSYSFGYMRGIWGIVSKIFKTHCISMSFLFTQDIVKLSIGHPIHFGSRFNNLLLQKLKIYQKNSQAIKSLVSFNSSLVKPSWTFNSSVSF